MEIICNKGVFGFGKGAVIVSSFGRPQHSLFRAYPKGSIRGNVLQVSISGPQGYIGGFFDSYIETTTNMLLSRPDSTINPVITSDVTKTLVFGLTHLYLTTHKNDDTHQSISKHYARQTFQIPESAETQQFPS